MWDTALQGLVLVIQWPAIGYMMFGIFLGLYVGAVPGLGGIVAMSILLPFTFNMEPVSAFAMLLGMYAVTATSDTLASVLLGVPGTAASQATILDGYPLAQKGEAARAFGAAFTCSAIGGVLGALVLALSIPIIQPLIMSFAQPEFFMLGLLGLTMVGSLSGNSMIKGLLAALLGLLMAQVGYSVQGGIARYYLGTPYLLDGLPLVPVVLGFFAIPEALNLAVRNEGISKIKQSVETQRKLMMQGVREAFTHWGLMLRCSVIGMYVGLLPGIGGSIVDWLAYGHAVQSAKDKSQFGKGDIRGVIAPESANNATRGPALIPTAVFGIPGTASMAILLGAFMIHGLTPGPQMLTTHLDLTFSFVWTIIIANIIGAGLLMLWSNQLAKITFVRGNLIVPAIILFVFMGSWMSGQQMGDWYTLLLFGLVGYVMKRGGWPRAPFVLGFILGPIMENALDISLQAFGWNWALRPISAVIIIIVVGTLAYAAYRKHKSSPPRASAATVSTATKSTPQEPIATVPKPSEEKFDLPVSFGFAVFLLALFAYAFGWGMIWPIDAALFPLATTIPALLMTAALLIRDGVALRRGVANAGGKIGMATRGLVFSPEFSREETKRTFYAFLWFSSVVVGTYLVGQKIALPVVVLLFLRYWAHESWKMAIIQSVVVLAFLYFMFELALNVLWYEPFMAKFF